MSFLNSKKPKLPPPPAPFPRWPQTASISYSWYPPNYVLDPPLQLHFHQYLSLTIIHLCDNIGLILLILRLAIVFCHLSYCTTCIIRPDLVSFPFYTIPVSPLCNFSFTCYTVQEEELFPCKISVHCLHGLYSFCLNYNVWLPQISISFFKSKRVNKMHMPTH